MVKSKRLLVVLAGLLAAQAAVAGGIRTYQDRVNVSPAAKGFNTYVNVVSGQLIHVRQDTYVAGRGLPLTVVFTYINSGWRMNYVLPFVPSATEDRCLRRPNGNVDAFVRQPDGSYEGAYGTRDELSAFDNGYRLAVWRDTINNRGDYATYYYDEPNVPGPTCIEDRNGNVLMLAYDANQDLRSIADATGHSLTFTYTDGHVTRLDDPAGRQRRYEYDIEGNLIRVTNPADETIRYQYAPNSGLCTAITDVRGSTWQITYVEDKVATVIDPSGHTAFQYAYDPNASTTRVTDGNGNTTVYRYDDKYRVVSVTDALGQTRTRQWGDDYALTSTTDAAGHTTSFARDAWGNPLAVTDALDQPATYTYDSPFHRVTSFTDQNGHTTRSDYDSNGNPIGSTDALGNETTYSYDDFGQVTAATDALGHTTCFEYDAFGNRTRITDALGAQTTFTYDALSNTTSRTNTNGHATTFEYDALGRLTKTVDALGGTTSITYDAVGNRLTQADNAGHTTRFEYDVLNRRTARLDPLGARTQYAYDAAGNLTSLTDANGNVTRYSYDALGRLTATTDASSGVASRDYDASGNLVSRTDANGNVTLYEHDALGRQVKMTTPLGNTWHYVYDAAGNLVERTDANGNVTAYAYDPLNRRTTTTYPDGRVDWSYDAMGRLTTVRNGLGLQDETAYEYDALDRVLSCTTGYGTAMDAQTVAYEYDPTGRRIKTVYPLGQTLEYAYDPASRLVKVDGFDGVTTYTYDTAGRRATMVYPNGMTLAYTYDAAGRTTRLTATDPDGQPIVEETYAYDAAGNKTHQSRDRDSTDRQIQYDALNRITSVTYHLPEEEVRTYTYDPAGNRLTETVSGVTTTFTYDADGRVTRQTGPDGTITYSYDNNGNRIRQDGPDGTIGYTFDAENRMVAVSLPTEYPAAIEYAYCAQGRKLMKRIGDWPTYYSHDGDAMITEQGPMWNGGMWRILYHRGISTSEDDVPMYPVYTTGNTSVAEVYPQGNWQGEIVHLLAFDEFGVKIKGSYEGTTQYGGTLWDPDPRYFWNGYDPGTGTNTSGPQPDTFDYSDFGVSDSDLSQMSLADLIRLRDAMNGKLSVGFFVDPGAGVSHYSFWTKDYAETIAVNLAGDPQTTGPKFGVYDVNPKSLEELHAEQNYQGLPGSVTDATQYSVVMTGDADRVIALIRNNLTGREEVAGMISTQALEQGAEHTPLGPPDASGVQRYETQNPVWESFSGGIVTQLRFMMFQDQQRGQ